MGLAESVRASDKKIIISSLLKTVTAEPELPRQKNWCAWITSTSAGLPFVFDREPGKKKRPSSGLGFPS